MNFFDRLIDEDMKKGKANLLILSYVPCSFNFVVIPKQIFCITEASTHAIFIFTLIARTFETRWRMQAISDMHIALMRIEIVR